MSNDSTCAPRDGIFSRSQETALKLVIGVGSSITIIGSLFIVLTFILFRKDLNTRPFRIIFYLALTFIVDGCNYLMGLSIPFAITDCPSPVCYASALIASFCDPAGILWTLAIGVNIFVVLVKGENYRWLEYIFHGVCWGFPVVLVIIGVALNVYGNAGTWCWIKPGSEYLAARLLLIYVWLLLAWVALAALYLYVLFSRLRNTAGFNVIAWRLSAYLLVFVGSELFSVINRAQNMFDSKPVFVLFLLQAIFEPARGFFTAMVYGMNSKVIRLYKDRFCPRSAKETDMDDVIASEDENMEHFASPSMHSKLIPDSEI